MILLVNDACLGVRSFVYEGSIFETSNKWVFSINFILYEEKWMGNWRHFVTGNEHNSIIDKGLGKKKRKKKQTKLAWKVMECSDSVCLQSEPNYLMRS